MLYVSPFICFKVRNTALHRHWLNVTSFNIQIKHQIIIWPKVTWLYCKLVHQCWLFWALQVQWQQARPSHPSVLRLLQHQQSVVTKHRGDTFTQQLQSKSEWNRNYDWRGNQPLKRMCVSAWVYSIRVRFYIMVATTLATVRQRKSVKPE